MKKAPAKKRRVRARVVAKKFPYENFESDVEKVLDACKIVPKKPPATFERCTGKVLGEALALSEQRGGEYADSFALENVVTTFTDATLRTIVKVRPAAHTERTNIAEIRLLQLAAIIDLKDARMIGPFKMDTVVDGINYRAVWGQLMQEYVDANGEVC